MKEPIKLASLTIDLSEVSEIYDYDDYVLLIYNSKHDPHDLKLTGLDAEAMRQWLDEDWRHCLEYLDSRGEGPKDPKARERPRYKIEPDESPQLDKEPPF